MTISKKGIYTCNAVFPRLPPFSPIFPNFTRKYQIHAILSVKVTALRKNCFFYKKFRFGTDGSNGTRIKYVYFNDPLTYEQRGIQSGIVDVLGTTCSCKSIQRTRHCSPVGLLLSTTNYPDHLYRLHLSRGAAPSKGRDAARQAITKRKRIIVYLTKRNDVGKSARHKITEYTIDRSSNSPRRNRNPRNNHEGTTKL